MKPSPELSYTLLRYPALSDLTPAQGISATSALVVELETLLHGVRKLRKSYIMRHVRDVGATTTEAEHTGHGVKVGKARMAAALTITPAKPD